MDNANIKTIVKEIWTFGLNEDCYRELNIEAKCGQIKSELANY